MIRAVPGCTPLDPDAYVEEGTQVGAGALDLWHRDYRAR
jgi:hypothetical protein